MTRLGILHKPVVAPDSERPVHPTGPAEAEQPEACALGECRSDFLPLLHQMSQVAVQTGDLSAVLRVLLELMQTHLNVIRSVVSLYDPAAQRIFIHEQCGLTAAELALGGWTLGEGIIGQVVETGVAIVIPDIRDEPELLHSTRRQPVRADENLSFLCVPIMRTDRVLGTISAERLYDNPELLNLDVEILSILAATIAQTVELHLMETVWRAALEDENRRLRSALRGRFKPTNIIGSSKPMRAVYRMLEKVTRAKTTVLILGESGVGKELVASAIHYNGPWADKPFVSFNCAALPEALIESELFGHERGAFTGALTQRRGRFEQADGGTLFLDEVGELSLPMQAKLLRVLQEKSFERVGSNVTIQVDLRILAATNRNLKQMVSDGLFRDDLYYRLNVFPITIPPLRERSMDVAALAEHFIGRFSMAMGVDVPGISSDAVNMLMCYHWPGNVRELENVIERAIILSEGELIQPEHLPPSLQPPKLPDESARGLLDTRLSLAERDIIVDALAHTQGNTTEAAAQLGLTRRMLGLRMAKYQLSYKDYRH